MSYGERLSIIESAKWCSIFPCLLELTENSSNDRQSPAIFRFPVVNSIFHRFLLNEWNEMSRNDGYDYWRLLETAELNKLVQNRFDFLQSSMNCELSKMLKCSALSKNCDWGKSGNLFGFWGHGFWFVFNQTGCQMGHLTECLTTAYATQRTLIYDSNGIDYGNLYEPLSKNCLEAYANKNETEYWLGEFLGR